MMKHLLILSFLFLHITTGYSQQSDLQRNDVLKGTVTANGKIIPALFSVWRMREGEPYGYEIGRASCRDRV